MKYPIKSQKDPIFWIKPSFFFLMMKFRATHNPSRIEIHAVISPIFLDSPALHQSTTMKKTVSLDKVLIFSKVLVMQMKKVRLTTFMKVNVHKVGLNFCMPFNLYLKERSFWEGALDSQNMGQLNPLIPKLRIRNFWWIKMNNKVWLRNQLKAKW